MQQLPTSAPKQDQDQAIGVFDSGVGGLTVVSALLSRLPNERLVYLGDTARVPYGSRSAQTVIRYSRNAARFLLSNRVKMVLIACNTASAAALPTLEAELSVPVLGAVVPGAIAAARVSKSRRVGVIGTLGTIRSGAYERALFQQAPDLQVVSIACPLLVPLVEEGWTQEADPVTLAVARRYLTPLAQKAPQLDTLVLGCTHYPLLLPVLSQVAAELFGHPVHLVDSASTMAEATEEALGKRGLLSPAPAPAKDTAQGQRRTVDRLRCFVTDESRVQEVSERFLGRSIPAIELVDL